MKTITNIICPAFALFAFACVALLPTAQAVLPAPDGGYPGANTAEGEDALFSLTTGIHNTAIGFNALYSNTTGFRNTACGRNALANNTTGFSNTAYGWDALVLNTTGGGNTVTGTGVAFNNSTGQQNTAYGDATLFSNTTGSFNTAYGTAALQSTTTGALNIALGYFASFNLTTGDNNIDIGNLGVAAEANTIRIGAHVAVTDPFGVLHPPHTATYIAGINGTAMPGGTGVVIDANGRLGTKPSSVRFKDDIKPMDKVSEALFALKPVTFRYRNEIDAERTPQFGLVAEDVEKVNPDLVVRDAEGKVFTVRYDAVNAMLLNEFLKEHRKNEKQEATIAELKAEISTLSTTVKEQASQIQKVRAQVELSKPAPQTVLNNQ